MPRPSHLRRLDELIYETKSRAFTNPTETQDEQAFAVLIAEWANFSTDVVMHTFIEALHECSAGELVEGVSLLWQEVCP